MSRFTIYVRTHLAAVEFPRGSRTAVLMAIESQQTTLWSDDGNGENARLTNWIVAHLGNPRDGLRAIYPGGTERG